MDYKNTYDVIIIGAGPSGAACAKLLLEGGLSVLIIERKKIPKYKCCGGFLIKDSQKYIKEIFGENIPKQIICKNRNINIRVTKTLKSFIDIPNIMLNTYRKKLDEWLIKKSKVKVKDNCSYLNHEFNNEIINVKLSNSEIINCQFLIGADGGYSSVRRNIDSYYCNAEFIIAFQSIFEIEDNKIDNKYCNYILGKKYSSKFAWYFVEDNKLFIGTSYYPRRKNPPYFLELFMKVKELLNIKELKHIRDEGCYNFVERNNNTFNFGIKNILLIGQASGLFSEFGEGISTALLSGKYAAESILNSKNPLKDYKLNILKTMNNVKESWIYFKENKKL